MLFYLKVLFASNLHMWHLKYVSLYGFVKYHICQNINRTVFKDAYKLRNLYIIKFLLKHTNFAYFPVFNFVLAISISINFIYIIIVKKFTLSCTISTPPVRAGNWNCWQLENLSQFSASFAHNSKEIFTETCNSVFGKYTYIYTVEATINQ